MNIMEWVKDYDIGYVFGGFHFMKLDIERNREYLLNSSNELMAHKGKYYTCHCTGLEQYEYLKGLMGDRLEYISCGGVINL